MYKGGFYHSCMLRMSGEDTEEKIGRLRIRTCICAGVPIELRHFCKHTGGYSIRKKLKNSHIGV